MLNDLNETLKQLLTQKAELPSGVEISFDIPTREWASGKTSTINLYLYDLRENRELRKMYTGEAGRLENGKFALKRQPVWLDLSYVITVWIKEAKDQNLVLWNVLQTLLRYSPLPDDPDILHGVLKSMEHPIRTAVAQPEGVLKNISEFWGALENQIRPIINLVVTLELDLGQVVTPEPLPANGRIVNMHLFDGQVIRPQPRLPPDTHKPYVFASDTYLLFVVVRDSQNKPIDAKVVRLQDARSDDQEMKPSPLPDTPGVYVSEPIPPGAYRLHIEVEGHPIYDNELTIPSPSADGALAKRRVQVHQVNVQVPEPAA